jgi:hypothetical protein
MSFSTAESPTFLSIGIMAWDEEVSIGPMLQSLFEQSVFQKLASQGRGCEVICLANGCTDGTVRVAGEIFARVAREHPAGGALRARVADMPKPGRNTAWNRFVHEFSAPVPTDVGAK